MFNFLWRVFGGATSPTYDEVSSPFQEHQLTHAPSTSFVIEESDPTLEYEEEVEISFEAGGVAKIAPLSYQTGAGLSDESHGKAKTMSQRLCEKISGR